MDDDEKLLKVRNLKTHFNTFAGVVKALDGINLDVSKGETLGLVGETGCGKSVTALSIIRLVPSPGKVIEGEVWFKNENLLEMHEEEMRKRIRGNRISMIFQDPMTSLNPLLKIGYQIAEAILWHQDLKNQALEVKIQRLKSRNERLQKRGLKFISTLIGLDQQIKRLENKRENPPEPSKKDRYEAAIQQAIKMLALTGVPDPENTVNRFPHELSGGMRQRVMIAMALACNPALLIADEPTTSLDATIQIQIIELMEDLKREFDTAILLITHHLGLVAELCTKVAVMYAGTIVEYADIDDLFKNPLHPYTRGLLKCIPKLSEKREKLETISGAVPDLIYTPSGCRFHPRCEHALDMCVEQMPNLVSVEKRHQVACFLYKNKNRKEEE